MERVARRYITASSRAIRLRPRGPYQHRAAAAAAPGHKESLDQCRYNHRGAAFLVVNAMTLTGTAEAMTATIRERQH